MSSTAIPATIDNLRPLDFPMERVAEQPGDVRERIIMRFLYIPKSAAFNAHSMRRYLVDTSVAAVTVTLPATPTAGDWVELLDSTASFATNNLTVARNSSPIDSAASNMALSLAGQRVTLIYVNATIGWKSIFSVVNGSVGFAAGAGGAVTQASSSSTGVTLNRAVGQITTVALTTAAAAEEVFTVTNSLVAAADIVVAGTTYAGAGTPVVSTKKTAAGAFDIVITNLHASAALNAAVVINFAVIKGTAS